MKHVLLLTLQRIPSAVLCGHAPLEYLAGEGKIEYRFRLTAEARGEDIRWADVLVFVRGDDARSFVTARAARRAGKTAMYVLDDDILHVPPGLESAPEYAKKETQGNIRAIMGECSVFLSPSRNLLEKYGGDFAAAARIEEPALFTGKAARRSDGPVRVGFAGSVDRAGDIDALLSGALRRLRREYGDRVEIEFFGARPAVAQELGLRCIPYQSSYEAYARTMASLCWDIGLAPMAESDFNRCKHYNKYIEYAARGIAGVYSDVEPYRFAVRDGENGLLCPNTEEAWFAALRRLVEDAALRQALSAAARRETETLYSLPAAAAIWEAVLAACPAAQGVTAELAAFDGLVGPETAARKLRQYGLRAPYHAARKIFRGVFGAGERKESI